MCFFVLCGFDFVEYCVYVGGFFGFDEGVVEWGFCCQFVGFVECLYFFGIVGLFEFWGEVVEVGGYVVDVVFEYVECMVVVGCVDCLW